MGVLYNKQFTGEIKPVVINKDTDYQTSTNFDYQEVSLVAWRDIVLKHLPNNANLATVESELKLEYLHFDYLIPSRVVVPSSAIPNMERRETALQKQVKTLEFKNKYNRNGDYAFEFRLLKFYDEFYKLDGITPYVNSVPYNAELDYPIADLIYNNRLPGYIDLMPYLIKTGVLTFADIKQELKLQILPKLSYGDVIVVSGGYSGSVTFELLPTLPTLTKSRQYTLSGLSPVQVLETNPNRVGFYLCNNSNNNISYSFNHLEGSNTKLILKPDETLIYENNKLIINNNEIDPGDSRFRVGCPLWVKNINPATSTVSIEELSSV